MSLHASENVPIPDRFQDIEPPDCKYVCVDWLDISENDAWNEDTSEFAEEPRTLTLAFLLGYEGQWLYLANNWCNDEWTYTLRIPRGCVVLVSSFEVVETVLGAASLEINDELYML